MNSAGPGGGPLSAEQFARYVEQRLALEDDQVELRSRDGMRLKVFARGRSVDVDLGRVYQAYLQNPAEIESVVRTVLRVAVEETPDRDARTYEAVADRIYPMLKPIELLVTVRERNLPMLVYREFLGGLIVTYVIDESKSVSYINEQHLERWGVSGLELHQRALQNLRRRTHEQTKYVTAGEGERRLFIYSSADGYDASRLLLTETLAEWASAVPGRLVIGVPNRDFLIAFSDADDEVLRAVAQQIQVDAAQQAHALTEQLFTLQGGQVREYDWE